MDQKCIRELNRKIRDLLIDYENHYSHRFEGFVEATEFRSPMKEGTIIIDIHSSRDFQLEAMESLVETLRTNQQTRGGAFHLLFWSLDGIDPALQNVRIQEIEARMPMALYEHPEQTTSEAMRALTYDVRRSKLIFVISDMNFLYESPKGDIFNYQKMKDRMIWIGKLNNRENINSCVQNRFLEYRNCIFLNS